MILVLWFKLVNPEAFNDDNIVVLFKFENPLTFNDEINVTLLFTINAF